MNCNSIPLVIALRLNLTYHMKITLSSFESTLYQKTGSKNIVRQLLVSKRSISLNTSEENRFYLMIGENRNKIFLSIREEYVPNKIQNIPIIKFNL